jgi:AraC-like DNA-binding protein
MPAPHLLDPDRASRPLVAKAEEYPSGSSISRHSHQRAQLIFLSLGALRLQTHDGVWVAPPGRAAWIPGNTVHWANYTKRSSVRIAYIDTTAFDGLPRSCTVFALTGLLRELVMRATDLGWHWPLDGRAERAMRVLVDEVANLVPLGLFLPHGRDPRLRRVIEALAMEPGDDRNLEDWTAVARTSPRTLARLFQMETGLSFGRWREQLRLICAIERLADGGSITRVAHDLGYSGAGAFTTMFTRAMGQPPRTYLAMMNERPPHVKDSTPGAPKA